MNNQTFSSHPIYDDEKEIIKAGNTPSPVNLRLFQRQINRIVGQSVDGKPLLRIAWGQDEERMKIISFGQWRMQHPFYQRADGSTIGVPRFYIQQLHTNAELHAGDNWEKARWTWIDDKKVDVLGPVPEQGFYSSLYHISYHDERCCAGRGVMMHPEEGIVQCHGGYRPPEQQDLEKIHRMYMQREQASNDVMAPSADLISKRAAEAKEKRDEKWRQGIRGEIDDFFNTHQHRFVTHDPTVLSHGKFHFMGGHTRSGITKNDLLRARDELSGYAQAQEMAMAHVEMMNVLKSPINDSPSSDGERKTD